MRFLVSILMSALLVLSACAPSGGGTPVVPGNPLGAVGHSVKDAVLDDDPKDVTPQVPANTNDQKIPYTIGGDSRVVTEIQKNRPDPSAPLTPAQEKEAAFSDSIRDAKLFRYNSKNEVVNLGDKKFKLIMQVQMQDGHKITVTYTGALEPSAKTPGFDLAKVTSSKVGYGLTGHITDGKDTSIGTFEPTFKDSKAKIFYRAYAVQWDIRTDAEQDWKDLGDLKSKLDRMKQAAEAGTIFGWAQNLVVAGMSVGVSVCHYDFLNKGAMKGISTDDMPEFSFDCESIRRGMSKPSAVSRLETKKGDIENVKVEGDGEDTDSRVFSATVKNKKGKAVEVMMIATRKSDDPEKALPENERTKLKPVEPANNEKFSQPPEDTEAPWEVSDEDVSLSQSVQQEKRQQQQQPAKTAQPQNQQPQQTQAEQARERQLREQKQREYQELLRLQQQQAQQAAQQKNQVQQVPQGNRPAESIHESYRGIGPNAFYYTDYSDPRTKNIIDALERNYSVPQVQAWIAQEGGQMRRFFYFATPFVNLIQAIAKKYHIPPAFTFLIVNESVYFSGKVKLQGSEYSEYSWDNPPSPNSKGKRVTTTGPFQMIQDTGYQNGLHVENNRNSPTDERNYFTPAACGAANYLGSTMDKFRDPTLGVMGYFRGPYAILPIVERYNKYSLTFAEVARNHMVDKEWIRYVARFVAAYFIAGDYPHYRTYEGRSNTVKVNQKKLHEIPSAYPGLSKGQPGHLRSSACEDAFKEIYNF